jgi:hypothetical protein
MDFYGYNNQEEAEQYWQLPDRSTWSIESVSVGSKGKHCTGSFPGGVYHYDDGSTDNGTTIQSTTVIIGNNKIKFEIYG